MKTLMDCFEKHLKKRVMSVVSDEEIGIINKSIHNVINTNVIYKTQRILAN